MGSGPAATDLAMRREQIRRYQADVERLPRSLDEATRRLADSKSARELFPNP